MLQEMLESKMFLGVILKMENRNTSFRHQYYRLHMARFDKVYACWIFLESVRETCKWFFWLIFVKLSFKGTYRPFRYLTYPSIIGNSLQLDKQSIYQLKINRADVWNTQRRVACHSFLAFITKVTGNIIALRTNSLLFL